MSHLKSAYGPRYSAHYRLWQRCALVSWIALMAGVSGCDRKDHSQIGQLLPPKEESGKHITEVNEIRLYSAGTDVCISVPEKVIFVHNLSGEDRIWQTNLDEPYLVTKFHITPSVYLWLNPRLHPGALPIIVMTSEGPIVQRPETVQMIRGPFHLVVDVKTQTLQVRLGKTICGQWPVRVAENVPLRGTFPLWRNYAANLLPELVPDIQQFYVPLLFGDAQGNDKHPETPIVLRAEYAPDDELFRVLGKRNTQIVVSDSLFRVLATILAQGASYIEIGDN